MAKVRWGGSTFIAEPVRQLPNGDWIMRAKQHGTRFSIGSEIRVTPDEILDMDVTMSAESASQSINELIAALADEKKTLPPLQTLIDEYKAAEEARRKQLGVASGPQEEQGETPARPSA